MSRAETVLASKLVQINFNVHAEVCPAFAHGVGESFKLHAAILFAVANNQIAAAAAHQFVDS